MDTDTQQFGDAFFTTSFPTFAQLRWYREDIQMCFAAPKVVSDSLYVKSYTV